jgi:hypothetical protein
MQIGFVDSCYPAWRLRRRAAAARIEAFPAASIPDITGADRPGTVEIAILLIAVSTMIIILADKAP